MIRMDRPAKPYHGSGGACPRHGSLPDSPLGHIRQQSLVKPLPPLRTEESRLCLYGFPMPGHVTGEPR